MQDDYNASRTSNSILRRYASHSSITMSTFQRRNFEFLAKNILYKKNIDKAESKRMAWVLGEWFRVLANFNRPRWYKECGVSKEELLELERNGNTKEVSTAGRNQESKSTTEQNR